MTGKRVIPDGLVPVAGAPPVMVNGAPTGRVLDPVYACCAHCTHAGFAGGHRKPCPRGCGRQA